MTLYDRVASTPDGARMLATTRLQREALRCLHRAMTAADCDVRQLATRLGSRPRQVARVLNGDGNISIGVLARYLHALGYELDIRLVQAGEPRAAVVEQRDVRAIGEDSDDMMAIRARVWETLARAGTSDEQLADLIGADPAKIAASLACDRRFSTYELAAIAEYGGTTVEWLCGGGPPDSPGLRAPFAHRDSS